jgi:hypothetical protein
MTTSLEYAHAGEEGLRDPVVSEPNWHWQLLTSASDGLVRWPLGIQVRPVVSRAGGSLAGSGLELGSTPSPRPLRDPTHGDWLADGLGK